MSLTKLSNFGVIRSLRIRYLLVIDLILIWISVMLAVAIRLESSSDAWNYLLLGGWVLLVVAPLVRLPLYYILKLYNRLWRYAGIEDLRSILFAGIIAPFFIAYINFGILPRMGIPNSPSRSVWILEAMGSLAMLIASRYILRLAQQRSRAAKRVRPQENTQLAVIVGAGDAGAVTLREIRQNASLGISVIAFVDDDKEKHGSALFGVPVLGSRYLIPELVRQRGVTQVIIAMPTAPGKVIREVVKICEEVDIRPQIVPSLHAFVNNYGTTMLRPVEIQDLLRREPITTDTEGVRKLLKNKRVLVTGGGGSIGRELCRQVLQFEPSQLIILGHGENSVFESEQELRQFLNGSSIRTELIACIADIRMEERIIGVFREYQPDVVFHTAAHKHVPLMEANVCEAVTNNILGTGNLLRAAQLVNVKRFVMISSDKAVKPTSVMGVCKRVAEFMVLDAAQQSGMPYAAVRFGNVLGSRGSVVLTFNRQIAAGGPVTVTDPEVKRFFMTIAEAVQLVLQAAVLEKGNEIFMLDMGEPVRIVDLAHDLIRLSGLEVGRDIDIEFTGLRPGEKMYEDLFLEGEDYHTTAHPKIRTASTAGRFVPDNLAEIIASLKEAARTNSTNDILRLLHQLVPEYQRAVETTTTDVSVRTEKRGAQPEKATAFPIPIERARLASVNGASD